jgi:cell division protease FtsH
MSGFPWFPLGHRLPGGSVGRLQHEGIGYQMFQNQAQDSVFLVLENECMVAKGAEQLLAPVDAHFHSIEFGRQSYLLRLFQKAEQLVVVRDIPITIGLLTSSDTTVLGKAIGCLREAFPKADVGSSVFLSAFQTCLPVREATGTQDLRSLAVELLAAGAKVPLVDINSIRCINSWLMPDEIQRFLAAFDVEITQPEAAKRITVPTSFNLPGRPELERFFREYILDPSADRERYAKLGVKIPHGVLLYGPTGSSNQGRDP